MSIFLHTHLPGEYRCLFQTPECFIQSDGVRRHRCISIRMKKIKPPPRPVSDTSETLYLSKPAECQPEVRPENRLEKQDPCNSLRGKDR